MEQGLFQGQRRNQVGSGAGVFQGSGWFQSEGGADPGSCWDGYRTMIGAKISSGQRGRDGSRGLRWGPWAEGEFAVGVDPPLRGEPIPRQ